MIYAIDYSADKLAIKSAPSEETLNKKGPAEGLERAIVRNEEEFAALDPALLLRIANFKTKGGVLTELPAISEIWNVLSPAPRAAKKKAGGELTGSPDSANSTSSEANLPPTNKPKEGKKVAAKKKAAKKKAAKKSANGGATGLPREGTKAAKLLALISKPGGATFAEMKAATGWKEMRGTALTLAARAGKTLTMIKDPDGKKASRWAAK